MNGHALGNLLILALWEHFGESVTALDWVGQLLDIKGRVLPMSSTPLEIEAVGDDDGGRTTVRGQVAVATSTGHVHHVAVIPKNPPAQAEALLPTLSEYTQACWQAVKPMGSGRWLSLEVDSPEVVEDIKTLLMLKRPLKKQGQA